MPVHAAAESVSAAAEEVEHEDYEINKTETFQLTPHGGPQAVSQRIRIVFWAGTRAHRLDTHVVLIVFSHTF